jgi:hypothetical protein
MTQFELVESSLGILAGREEMETVGFADIIETVVLGSRAQ